MFLLVAVSVPLMVKLDSVILVLLVVELDSVLSVLLSVELVMFLTSVVFIADLFPVSLDDATTMFVRFPSSKVLK